MTFHAMGFRTLGVMGLPSATASPGSARQFHTFVTNDDKAAIETANYFDALLTPAGKVIKGDILVASFDADGTEGVKMYVIDIVSSHVVLSGIGTAAGLAALGGSLTGSVTGSLVAIAAPTDSPATADALRDDLAANMVPAINLAFKETQTKLNALIALFA